MERSLETKPEDGGSWFVLCVEPNSVVLHARDVARAFRAFDGDLIEALHADGYTPLTDDSGNWLAWALRADVHPTTVPASIEHVAKFIASGTVVTLDNGCFPSLEWRFDGLSVLVFDTFDYWDAAPSTSSE